MQKNVKTLVYNLYLFYISISYLGVIINHKIKIVFFIDPLS